MVNTKKAPGKKTGKLKLKKETIKDLDVKGKAGRVKGGTAYFVAYGAPKKAPVGTHGPPVATSATCFQTAACG